jgi:hypothetical protein
MKQKQTAICPYCQVSRQSDDKRALFRI